ncbi:hypothetical protein GCM10022247_06500 [Allokutzneria multivorans]|uniref:AMIN-like domain-containing protein n=1 Tax=Allokutzneria multivorans TaxID=1142134 RepID=A0ABP7R192_9PSEU
MRRRTLTCLVVLTVVAGCTQQAPPAPTPAPTPAASTASTAAPSSPSTVAAPEGAAVLSSVRVGSHPGHDRIVFEFNGTPPTYDHSFVDRVTQDGSGAPVPLQGKAFLQLTLHGATTDNSFQVTDPARALRYDGPRRLTPALAVVQEVAQAGDFEADLSFGIGLNRRTPPRVSVLTGPTRVILDLDH